MFYAAKTNQNEGKCLLTGAVLFLLQTKFYLTVALGYRQLDKTIDAVVRNFEIIGEAANRISPDFKENNPEVDLVCGIKDYKGEKFNLLSF